MRADCSSVGSAPEFGSVLPERRHGRIGFARARAAGRSDDFEHASADEGNSTHRHRRRDAAGGEGTGFSRRDIRRSRRRRNGDRNQKARRLWLDQAGRNRRTLQHRHGLQIRRSLAARTPVRRWRGTVTTRRLYYDDGFEKEFSARVLYCEVLPPDVNSGITGTVWKLILDRTAFYPTSGGQPNDLGKIGDANVIDVRDEGEEISHVVDRRPADPEVNGCINWPRRFDHMQQHTGQHLLSAMFQERFGLPTVSFHLGEEICTIDLHGAEPSRDQLIGAQRAANKAIFEDRPVTVRYGTREQLAQLGVRKEVEREGLLRAIEIEGADLQPCGGTHVKSTGQIGMILVRGCSKVRQDWRVEFVCGRRAEQFATDDFERERVLMGSLGCALNELPAAVARLGVERDAHFKSLRAALQQLAALWAVQLASSAP